MENESNTNRPKMTQNGGDRKGNWFLTPRPYLIGSIASFAVLGIYLGMNTLIADWDFAQSQFIKYRWWVIPLAFGLGIQVTLFSLFRAQHKRHGMKAAKSSIAASGGVSTAAMMACCSHYLATLLPTLSLPFLSAAAVTKIAEYQTYFFLAGIISSLFGIGLMLQMMKKNGMIQAGIIRSIFYTRFQRVSG